MNSSWVTSLFSDSASRQVHAQLFISSVNFTSDKPYSGIKIPFPILSICYEHTTLV